MKRSVPWELELCAAMGEEGALQQIHVARQAKVRMLCSIRGQGFSCSVEGIVSYKTAVRQHQARRFAKYDFMLRRIHAHS